MPNLECLLGSRPSFVTPKNMFLRIFGSLHKLQATSSLTRRSTCSLRLSFSKIADYQIISSFHRRSKHSAARHKPTIIYNLSNTNTIMEESIAIATMTSQEPMTKSKKKRMKRAIAQKQKEDEEHQPSQSNIFNASNPSTPTVETLLSLDSN